MLKFGVLQTELACAVEWESLGLQDLVQWTVLEIESLPTFESFVKIRGELDGVIWYRAPGALRAEWEPLLAQFNQLPERGKQVWIWMQEGADEPEPEYLEGYFDELLLVPVRKLDIQTKLAQVMRYRSIHELSQINQDFSETLAGLREDLDLATRLQKSRLPRRFEDVRGIRISHRYLAGVKAGGDYFDLADNREETQLSLVLTDSSSHGLSNSVLSVLMRVAVKLSQTEVSSARETIRRIADEILMTLSLRDHLSLLYGVISRKDFRFHYVNWGHSRVIHLPQEGPGRVLESHGLPLTRSQGLPSGNESSVSLEASDRLLIVSDGYLEGMGGEEQFVQLAESLRDRPSVDLQNELAFRIKSRLKDDDAMPDQDCTLVVLEMDSKLIRRVS